MKVLFYTNLPSPYRVDFFNLLGKSVELTVVFTERRSQNVGWVQGGEHIGDFKAVFLCDTAGKSKNVYPEAIQYAQEGFDAVFVTNYASPTEILLLRALKQRRIPYILEVDGGFIREESALKRQLKKYLITGAEHYLSTDARTDGYLAFYGADRAKIRRYPLASVFAAEVADAPADAGEKAALRKTLGLPDGPLVLFAGQLIRRKGVDILVEAAKQLPDLRFCIVGNGDASVYRAPDNVLFAGQKNKAELAQYYRAADLFALPTREDIWGLVVGEAVAKGLPVVTTDRCNAGVELLDQNFIVPAENTPALTAKLAELLADPAALETAGEAALSIARRCTIEAMVKAHLEFLADL